MAVRTPLSLTLLAVLFNVFASPRTNARKLPESSGAPYANTAEGLKLLLNDMRTAAKSGDETSLASFIKNTEIPDCGAWLHKMYATDKADSGMALCEGESRDPRERDLTQMFRRIGKVDGEFVTRKVNDNPEPGHGLEWGMLQAIRQPLDIYWAGWLASTEPNESGADPVGYFMFIDGGFRWDSTITSLRLSKINPVIDQPPAKPSNQNSVKQFVRGTTYQNDTSNFSLTVPSGWLANDQLANQIPGFVGAVLAPGLSPGIMVQRLYPPGVVEGARILQSLYQNGFKSFKKLDEGELKIDGKECYFFSFSAVVSVGTQPKIDIPTDFLVTLIPDGQSVLALVGQAPESDFAKSKPIIKSVENSFKSDRQ
jgi:hypothetical protein